MTQQSPSLDKDLAAAREAGKHLAVVHHEPYFTSETEAHERAEDPKPWIDVSTGGIELRPFTSSPQYIEKRFSDTHGFLRLTLRTDGSFDWNFVPTTGEGTDEGTRPAPEPEPDN